jgi:thiol-disulfide isomerase/thioredoxin
LLVIGVVLSVALKATGFNRIEGAVQELGPLKVGARAPDGMVESVSGAEVALASMRGRAVLLEFGATWCGPCRAMFPSLRALQSTNASRPVDVVTVDVGESAEVVRKHYAARKVGGVKIMLDPSGDVAVRYGVHAFPTLVIVDKQGTVRMIHVGGMRDFGPVEHLVEELAGS